MKKILSIYLIILAGVFVLLSVLGTKSDIVVEKKIWQLTQQHIDIAKDPNVIPDRSFDQVINGYRDIIENNPNSRLIPGLHIRVGEMYILRKDYEGALKNY